MIEARRTRPGQTTRHRGAALLAALTVSACAADLVEVHVVLGDCDPSVVPTLLSADVVLKRDDNAKWVGGCARAVEPPTDIDAFGDLLEHSFTFREVPVGGRWTLAVKGFSDKTCSPGTAIFCGRTMSVTLPPPAGGIEVSLNCPPVYTDLEDYKACVRE